MKRLRDGTAPYKLSPAERAEATKAFIKSLRFSHSLGCLRDSEALKRHPCPKCGRRRQYYCYDCRAVCYAPSHPPPLRLPLEVIVLLHPKEVRGKSTSLAASTISPDIHIHIFPDVPPHINPCDTLVLYPSPDACSLEELSLADLHQYKQVVFIDSTWQQSKQIARDPRVAGLKHVRIRSRDSLFWRFQDKDPGYLATVEAIYYFLRDYVSAKNKGDAQDAGGNGGSQSGCSGVRTSGPILDPYYHGEVDDLLYYFIHQYILVQESYKPSSGEGGSPAAAGAGGTTPSGSNSGNRSNGGRSFTHRHFEGYLLDQIDWSDVLR